MSLQAQDSLVTEAASLRNGGPATFQGPSFDKPMAQSLLPLTVAVLLIVSIIYTPATPEV